MNSRGRPYPRGGRYGPNGPYGSHGRGSPHGPHGSFNPHDPWSPNGGRPSPQWNPLRNYASGLTHRILDNNEHRQGHARAHSDSTSNSSRQQPTKLREMQPSSLEEGILILNNIDPLSGPTPYEVTEPDVLRRQFDPKAEPKTKANMRWEPVVEMLQAHNDPRRPLNAKERAAVDRLQGLGKLSKWYPDIFFKIFLDIDLLFFSSTLRDNVTLLWTLEPQQPAFAYVTGVHESKVIDTPRLGIHLNGSLLVSNILPFHEAVMIFIHECIHAYMFTHCNRNRPTTWMGETDYDSKDPAHGEAFQACMKAVQARCGRTRYIYFQTRQDEQGGTVALGTDLRHRWDSEGGFMVDGEREVGASSARPENNTVAVMEQIDRGDLPMTANDSRPAAREAVALAALGRLRGSGLEPSGGTSNSWRSGRGRNGRGRGDPLRGGKDWPGRPGWSDHRGDRSDHHRDRWFR